MGGLSSTISSEMSPCGNALAAYRARTFLVDDRLALLVHILLHIVATAASLAG